jgi:hypothetical protein
MRSTVCEENLTQEDFKGKRCGADMCLTLGSNRTFRNPVDEGWVMCK